MVLKYILNYLCLCQKSWQNTRNIIIRKIREMVMYFKTALEVNVLKVNGIFGIA